MSRQITAQQLTRIAFAVCIGLILILSAVIIFRKPQVVVSSDKEKVLRDSLQLMQRQIDSSRVHQAKLQSSYDSLLTIDPQIQYRTREKIKFIFNTASPSELDSIIRTNWKTGSRYN